MSKQTGYTCDGCQKFEPSGSTVPTGWVQAVVRAPRFKPEPTFAAREDDEDPTRPETLDFCGNHCLALWAVERAKGDGTWEEKARRVTRSRSGVVQRSTLMKYHNQGKHAEAPAEGCPKCEEPGEAKAS